ncbi:hypothetical protein [Luteimonas cucumeris]|uniref:hypothetical protein n=1 Tax=Luteimonas cucumeris TaxID=985012 RepID=UPI0011A1AA78|nr:hypothetical protein [Luteimonas cucumeris]
MKQKQRYLPTKFDSVVSAPVQEGRPRYPTADIKALGRDRVRTDRPSHRFMRIIAPTSRFVGGRLPLPQPRLTSTDRHPTAEPASPADACGAIPGIDSPND